MRAGRAGFAALFAALFLWQTVHAGSQSGEDAFYAATELAAAGKHREAAEAFVALASADPSSSFADDALVEAARIHEERLGEPELAAGLYERVLRDYPASRLVLRARARAEDLRRALGPGARDAAAVTELNDVLQGFSIRPREESVARMERLLGEHPDFVDAPRAAFWLGGAYRDEGREAEALARFEEVTRRWPDSEWSARARKATGDMLVVREDWAGAEAAYRSITGPGTDWTIADALTKLAAARRRARLSDVSLGLFVLVALVLLVSIGRDAGGARATLRALRSPPFELLLVAPVLALFVVVALTEHHAMTKAVTWISAGAVLIVWLSGAALRAATSGGRRLPFGRAAAQAALTGAAILGLVYVGIVENGLYDLVLETVKYGAEH